MGLLLLSVGWETKDDLGIQFHPLKGGGVVVLLFMGFFEAQAQRKGLWGLEREVEES